MLNSCIYTLIDTHIEPRYPYNIGIDSLGTVSLNPWLADSLGFGWNRHNNSPHTSHLAYLLHHIVWIQEDEEEDDVIDEGHHVSSTITSSSPSSSSSLDGHISPLSVCSYSTNNFVVCPYIALTIASIVIFSSKYTQQFKLKLNCVFPCLPLE